MPERKTGFYGTVPVGERALGEAWSVAIDAPRVAWETDHSLTWIVLRPLSAKRR
jgi:hypothetical protein